MKILRQNKSQVKGIVLAGGEGKRLRPLSYYFQKCMIPIGHKQKPLLEYIIRLLRYHGISDISLLVGYKYEQITNYFNGGERFDSKISYVLDDPELKGTGGSLLNLYRRKLVDEDDVLLVYYGDILSNLDLAELLRRHRKRGAAATLALSKGFQVRVGVAEVRGEDVVNWVEKPTLDINAGVGVLAVNASVLEELEVLSKQYAELDIMSHLVPRLIEKRDVVQAYFSDAFWYDVGSVELYEKLENGVVEKNLGFLAGEKDKVKDKLNVQVVGSG